MMAKQKKFTFNTYVKAPPPNHPSMDQKQTEWKESRIEHQPKSQNLLALTPLVFVS